MDTEVWRVLAAAVKSADRSVPRSGRRCQFSDILIAKMFLWAAWHDRPLCWACDRVHYNTLFRPRQLPSVSQFSRRVKKPRVRQLLHKVNQYLTRTARPVRLAFIDGKPLPVRKWTRDPDTRWGWGSAGFETGYRLHAWVTQDGRITDFKVLPMNVGEAKVAYQLLHAPPEAELVMADANYDTQNLYKTLGTRGQQLLTPLKRVAKNAAPLRRMGAERRFAIRLRKHLGRAAYRALLQPRRAIERVFSTLTCYGSGLHALPTFVRRQGRVERWVTAKIAIYHARLRLRKQVA